MKFYLAPLEGLTGYIFRNALAKYFTPLDKYFTPFIAANQKGKLSSRELNDILPEHNPSIKVVPQILTNKAEDFILTTKHLQDYGYDEVNLNLGCPSGTVVSKNRGAGFLAVPDALEQFLEEIFKESSTKISIKTRIGKDSSEEFENLMRIFNEYPLEELIIHPRIQKDYYKYAPRLEVFEEGLRRSRHPVCYNGDLFTVSDYNKLTQRYPKLERVMLGRGLIANPGLVEEIILEKPLDIKTFKAFHDEVYVNYQEVLYGERNVLFKMKEMWFYMSYMFEDIEKCAKKIKKSQRLTDYEAAVEELFATKSLIKGAGLFRNA